MMVWTGFYRLRRNVSGKNLLPMAS